MAAQTATNSSGDPFVSGPPYVKPMTAAQQNSAAARTQSVTARADAARSAEQKAANESLNSWVATGQDQMQKIGQNFLDLPSQARAVTSWNRELARRAAPLNLSSDALNSMMQPVPGSSVGADANGNPITAPLIASSGTVKADPAKVRDQYTQQMMSSGFRNLPGRATPSPNLRASGYQ